LSSRYEGTWKPEYEPLLARHIPRRLTAEEILDALAVISGLHTQYTFVSGGAPETSLYSANRSTVEFAMQLPQTSGMPAEDTAPLLDALQRGNRTGIPRRGEGSLAIALHLMHGSYLQERTRATSGPLGRMSLAFRLLEKHGADYNDDLMQELYLTVLNRPITEPESILLNDYLNSPEASRRDRVENLVWALFNKLDFLFNY
jgi:hypothetical protein